MSKLQADIENTCIARPQILKFLQGSPKGLILRLALVITALTFTSAAFPAEQDEMGSAQLTVGIAECPPFVIFENELKPPFGSRDFN